MRPLLRRRTQRRGRWLGRVRRQRGGIDPAKRKVDRRAQLAIFSCAKAPQPFVPEKRPELRRRQKRFRLQEWRSGLRLRPEKVGLGWQVFHRLRRWVLPSTRTVACFRKPVLGRNLPVAERNPPP